MSKEVRKPIKRCPFCNSKPVIRTMEFSLDGSETLVIECVNKECLFRPSSWMHHPHTLSSLKLINNWNKRGETI